MLLILEPFSAEPGQKCCSSRVVGKQGKQSGESARLPPMCPGFDSRTRRYTSLSLLLVLNSAPRGFSPGASVSLSSQKPTFAKFLFDLFSSAKSNLFDLSYLFHHLL